MAATGFANEMSRAGPPDSIMDRTIAVVPSLSSVAVSDRFASPTMTCRRRQSAGSACGSSRVLMIGRFSVVSRPTSTSKKSARLESWNPWPRPSCPRPTRPAPVNTCRVTKNGISASTTALKGVRRSIR